MVPPSVRIEGCTPPSDSSIEGELYKCKLGRFFNVCFSRSTVNGLFSFLDVARGSIDSTLEFRQSDLINDIAEDDDGSTPVASNDPAITNYTMQRNSVNGWVALISLSYQFFSHFLAIILFF